MEFTVERNALAIAVTNAVHGIPNNPSQPVRAGMFIWYYDGAIAFTGSDGDATFTSNIPCVPDNHHDVTVPGKLFSEVVKTLPDKEVHFATDGNTVILTCGAGQFKFPAYIEEYPQLAGRADNLGEIEATAFADAIRKVVPAAAKTDSNPALTGVLLEPDGDTLWVASTDRYRLAAVECGWTPGGDAKRALLPAWAAERFARNTEDTVYLGWDDRVVTLRSGRQEVTTRVIAGEFPGWRKLLPEKPCSVEVDTEALLGALKRAQLAAEAESPVEITFVSGQLMIEAGEDNRAYDVLDAKYEGDEFKALFGIGKLVDGLAGCGDTAYFGFTEPLKPVHIQSGNYSYTVLPRRRL